MGMPDIDLPNAEVGKVCLRFAPEPNGYFHIGHSKAALLNKYFAEKYKGRLIIRFDDTNPAKESNVFVQSLLKDIDTLGIVYDAVTFTSDYFPQLLKMAEKLIQEGKAYVDDTPVAEMRIERSDGTKPRCRSNTKEKNLELWNEMIRGSDQGKSENFEFFCSTLSLASVFGVRVVVCVVLTPNFSVLHFFQVRSAA